MTSQANAESEATQPDATQVHDYLAIHAEFFNEYPELLADMQLSHASGKAVSLIERQVQVLREQNRDLKQRLLELVDVARDNDRLNDKVPHHSDAWPLGV